jgi:hypothetical protein
MNILKNQLVKRFAKAFLTGGLLALGAALALGVKVSSLEDVKSVAILLVTAFVSGGIHALVEVLNPTVGADVQSVVTVVSPTTAPATVTTTSAPAEPVI